MVIRGDLLAEKTEDRVCSKSQTFGTRLTTEARQVSLPKDISEAFVTPPATNSRDDNSMAELVAERKSFWHATTVNPRRGYSFLHAGN